MAASNEKLFSGALTLMSILLGVFTFAIVSAIDLKGTYPEAYPWYAVSFFSGLSIVLSSIICISSYFSESESTRWGSVVNCLFLIVLIMCGVGIPVMGMWIFINSV
jgi:hypothetical protein